MKRPFALRIIVLYKLFVAGLLFAATVALFFVLENRQPLLAFSDSYVLAGPWAIIGWLIQKLLRLSPRTLEFSTVATGFYGLTSLTEATGLWFQKRWAEFLVIGLTGISIPPELFELAQGFSGLKLGVFIGNILILGYLIYRLVHSQREQS
jgi:uncharacterized membrane protein (DUF2068 family)